MPSLAWLFIRERWLSELFPAPGIEPHPEKNKCNQGLQPCLPPAMPQSREDGDQEPEKGYQQPDMETPHKPQHIILPYFIAGKLRDERFQICWTVRRRHRSCFMPAGFCCEGRG